MIEIVKQQELDMREGTDCAFWETVVMTRFMDFIVVEKYRRSSGWFGTEIDIRLRAWFKDGEEARADKWYELLCAGEEYCLEDKMREAFDSEQEVQ
jgi:hypothetical protein